MSITRESNMLPLTLEETNNEIAQLQTLAQDMQNKINILAAQEKMLEETVEQQGELIKGIAQAKKNPQRFAYMLLEAQNEHSKLSEEKRKLIEAVNKDLLELKRVNSYISQAIAQAAMDDSVVCEIDGEGDKTYNLEKSKQALLEINNKLEKVDNEIIKLNKISQYKEKLATIQRDFSQNEQDLQNKQEEYKKLLKDHSLCKLRMQVLLNHKLMAECEALMGLSSNNNVNPEGVTQTLVESDIDEADEVEELSSDNSNKNNSSRKKLKEFTHKISASMNNSIGCLTKTLPNLAPKSKPEQEDYESVSKYLDLTGDWYVKIRSFNLTEEQINTKKMRICELVNSMKKMAAQYDNKNLKINSYVEKLKKIHEDFLKFYHLEQYSKKRKHTAIEVDNNTTNNNTDDLIAKKPVNPPVMKIEDLTQRAISNNNDNTNNNNNIHPAINNVNNNNNAQPTNNANNNNNFVNSTNSTALINQSLLNQNRSNTPLQMVPMQQAYLYPIQVSPQPTQQVPPNNYFRNDASPFSPMNRYYMHNQQMNQAAYYVPLAPNPNSNNQPQNPNSNNRR